MTGYEIYKMCRSFQHRRSPNYDTFVKSPEYNFYNSLAEWFTKKKKFTTQEVKDYLCVISNKSAAEFDPYDIIPNEQSWDEFYDIWKKTASSKSLYFEAVRNSFIFIQNFCIKRNISIDTYKRDWVIKHIRSGEVDSAVAIYLKLIEKSELSQVQKILLKHVLKQYNIILDRIRDSELNSLLAELKGDMDRTMKAHAGLVESSKPSNSTKSTESRG